MIKLAAAIVVIQTPLGGPQNIGINASLQEKLKVKGVIRVKRGAIRNRLKVELLSLEGDTGKELRVSPAIAKQFGLSDLEKVIVQYNHKTNILRIRGLNAK